MEIANIFIPGIYFYFILAIIVGIITTFLSKTLAWKINFLDRPKGTVPQHTKSIAYLGGLGIFLGIISVNLLFGLDFPISFFVFAFIFMLLGLVDDVMTLRPMHKFLIQVVAALCAAKFCVAFSFLDIPFLDLIISAFWYLVLLNAFNLTDVCDGLVGGIAVVIFLLSAFSFPDINIFWLIIAGSILGFLVFNSPPASIFMGDAGSHLIGFIAAYMTMSNGSIFNDSYSFYALACLCAVPLFEMTFLVIIRYRKGLAWWLSSKDHFALRLQRHGLSKWQTDVVAYILTFISGLPVYWVYINGDISLTILTGLILFLIILFLIFWWYLINIERIDNLKEQSKLT